MCAPADQTIECEYVVNCAGMWARELGERNGLVIPNQAAEHYYLITDTIEGLDPNAPIFEDPSSYGYYREEGGGMMVGLFEPQAAAWQVDGIPADFSFLTLPPDWDRMAPFLEKAMARVPITLEVGVRTFFCGPESFTPDLSPAVGEAPGIRGYFVAAGMNSVGVLSAGGLGRVLAHWITEGEPDVDVTGFNVDRFRDDQLDPAYRASRTTEILGTVYAAHTPGKQLRTARDRLLSPVHERLVEQGGYLREVSGWEGADWFAGAGRHTGRASPPGAVRRGSTQWEAEHRAVREGVGLMDMSFMAKFRVGGAGAGDLLDQLSAGAVNGDPGVITYTQWLNDDGRIEADLTVTKLGDDDFFVVASDTAHGHVLRADAPVRRRSLSRSTTSPPTTPSSTCRGRARATSLRSSPTPTSSTEVFPFRSAGWVELAGVRLLLARITYLGELGYELYVPRADALAVYDAVQAAGATHGLVPTGPQGARVTAHGEGVPRLRPRHRQHRLPAGGRARVRTGARQAGRLHRPRRRPRAQEGECRGGRHGAADRAGSDARPRAAAVPRRDRCCATACRSATYGPARTAGRSARRSAWPWSRATASSSRQTGWRPGRGRSTSPGRATPPRSRCARCTTRPAPASAPSGRAICG